MTIELTERPQDTSTTGADRPEGETAPDGDGASHVPPSSTQDPDRPGGTRHPWSRRVAAGLLALGITVGSGTAGALAVTSLEPTRPDETARLAALIGQAGQRLQAAGYTIVDTAPVADEVAKVRSLKDCNGCELPMAQRLGADLAAVGWVQKVSNLILNINLQIREVATGRLVKAGSVDIRGNTDEAWQRGITYLIDRRIAAH